MNEIHWIELTKIEDFAEFSLGQVGGGLKLEIRKWMQLKRTIVPNF